MAQPVTVTREVLAGKAALAQGIQFRAVGEQSENDPLEFIMSTAEVDRMGDIIQQDWELRDFKKNPISLWQHDSHFPIGTWSNVRVEGGKLMGKLKLASRGTSELISTIWSLLEQRIIRAVSVGFTADNVEDRKDKDGRWLGFVFKDPALVECSLVSVPANPSALQIAKSMGLRGEALKEFFPDLRRSVPEVKSDPIKDPSPEVVERVLASSPTLRGLFS